jgi:hypothetical protein
MNTVSYVFSIIGIVAMVFLFGNQAFAYGGYGDYGGYPYGGYYDPGSPPPYAYCSFADYKKNVLSYGDCSYYPFGY